jgi:phosphoribosylamine--glycine ligase
MQVLIIGGGGREHALAWKVAQSSRVDQVYVAPGNAGTALENKCENVPIAATAIAELAGFAQQNNVDLTIVGPEAALVDGIIDVFSDQGLKCFGPTQQAAQLEGSKSFTKAFLTRHNIPTAAYETFTELEPAVDYIRAHGTPIVIKADGLAAGKGVTVAQTLEQALHALQDCFTTGKFGAAGYKIVIEDFLQGEEVSFICMVDGEHVLPLATSQDHKARDDGDRGPNTGGMGAYSPAPVVSDEVRQEITQQIIQPTVTGLAAEGMPYTGFLYAGLMITPKGDPYVIEYNCRLGDPETQPILMRLQSDLVTLCESAIDGKLEGINAEWDDRAALGVVLAAGGYPDAYNKGDVIAGLESIHDSTVKIFHAGTAKNNADILTNGGRVLCVTALGDDVATAQAAAYAAAGKIHWHNMVYRSDIGYRAISRLT